MEMKNIGKDINTIIKFELYNSIPTIVKKHRAFQQAFRPLNYIVHVVKSNVRKILKEYSLHSKHEVYAIAYTFDAPKDIDERLLNIYAFLLQEVLK